MLICAPCCRSITRRFPTAHEASSLAVSSRRWSSLTRPKRTYTIFAMWQIVEHRKVDSKLSGKTLARALGCHPAVLVFPGWELGTAA